MPIEKIRSIKHYIIEEVINLNDLIDLISYTLFLPCIEIRFKCINIITVIKYISYIVHCVEIVKF